MVIIEIEMKITMSQRKLPNLLKDTSIKNK